MMIGKRDKQTVIMLHGFFTPTNWVSYPPSLIPDNVNLITIYPSSVASLHDRACQIFYELKGGRVDYGEEHSRFHGHDRYGELHPVGLLSDWDEAHPIIIIAHSLGGNTAWVLQNYLELQRFPGHETSSRWISGIICINSPLNGTETVNLRGTHLCFPQVVELWSQGYVMGAFSHIVEYLDWRVLRSFFDCKLDAWRLQWHRPGSLQKLFTTCLGYCAVHSNTDNIAHDASITSQHQWQKLLHTFPSCYYISIVGDVQPSLSSLTALEYLDNLHLLLVRTALFTMPPIVSGMNSMKWMDSGTDNLLSVFTQEFPRLHDGSSGVPHSSDAAPGDRVDQRLGQEYGSIRADAFPVHNRQYISDLVSDDLKIGMWNYTRRDMSHLRPLNACHKSWTIIFQALQSLLVASSTALKLEKTRDSSSKEQPTRLVHIRPDMQTVDFSLPCVDSSFGMSYRYSNLLKGICLLVMLVHGGSGGDWRRVTSMTLDENAFVLLSILWLLWMVRRYCYKHCTLGDLQPQVYFVNETWMLSCLWETCLLGLRMLPAALMGSRDQSVSYLQSGSFVLEAAVKCLLPQPLYRENMSLVFLVFGAIVNYNHEVWASMQKYLLAYFAAFSLLPKCAWLCVYLLPRPNRSLQPSEAAAVTVTEAAVWTAMAAFLATWMVYLCRLAALLSTDCSMMLLVGRYSYAPLFYVVLLALLPCRHMVELSDCLQFVLISKRYHLSPYSKR